MIALVIRILAAFGLCLALNPPARADGPMVERTAIAMHGEPALPPDFAELPYVNPEAPKGGRITLAYLGAFDSLNPYNVKALSTAQGLIGNVYQSLMQRSLDEPFTLYGLIARSIETDDAREHVIFHLDPRAHFSDGAPIRAADVLFTFNLLKDKGRPQQRSAYRLVKSVVAKDDLTVAYDLTGSNDRELPLTLALMPVLSPAHTDADHFDDQTLQIPVASGPYVVAEVKPGERLVLKRDPNYWGKDLPLQRGLYNADELRLDYYRDATAMFEAFKAGLIDFRDEDDPTRWNGAYDFPALKDGRVVKEAIHYGLPKGVSGFAFNLRRDKFSNVRVREALASMFDFPWINANLYGGAYTRSSGFFDDSVLSSLGRPASAGERALLKPFPGAVTPEAMEGDWRAPTSDGTGRDRAIAKAALDKLAAAGLKLEGGRLLDATGAPFGFEITVKAAQDERLALAYAQSLRRIGIDVNVRLIDEVQFQRRRTAFDFDMMIGSWFASPSPGGEQRGRWSAAAADMQGSYNICGVRSPAVDAMIDAILAARTHEDYVDAVRALDRVLISGAYIVPLFYSSEQWVAYSARLGHPPKIPMFGVNLESWWVKP